MNTQSQTWGIVAASALAFLITAIPNTAHAMGVSFSWSKSDACATRSPAFRLSGVPKGTKKLRFQMKDLNVPSYYHGGGSVSYKGARDARGAFSYKGPCPPRGQTHRYRWTVRAMDAKGKTVGTASATKSFRR